MKLKLLNGVEQQVKIPKRWAIVTTGNSQTGDKCLRHNIETNKCSWDKINFDNVAGIDHTMYYCLIRKVD